MDGFSTAGFVDALVKSVLLAARSLEYRGPTANVDLSKAMSILYSLSATPYDLTIALFIDIRRITLVLLQRSLLRAPQNRVRFGIMLEDLYQLGGLGINQPHFNVIYVSQSALSESIIVMWTVVDLGASLLCFGNKRKQPIIYAV
jgi:hypothetical protein